MINERLQILVRPDQRRRLEVEAKRRGTSVAALVREAVDVQFGAVSPSERLDALEHIRALRGQFLSPEGLNKLGEQEQADGLQAMLNANRR